MYGCASAKREKAPQNSKNPVVPFLMPVFRHFDEGVLDLGFQPQKG